MNIKAGMLAAQNVGSVISFIDNGYTIITTLEGIEIEPDSGHISAYTPIQDDPFILDRSATIELSLPKGSHDISILLKEFIRFADDTRDEWEDAQPTVVNNYSEVSA